MHLNPTTTIRGGWTDLIKQEGSTTQGIAHGCCLAIRRCIRISVSTLSPDALDASTGQFRPSLPATQQRADLVQRLLLLPGSSGAFQGQQGHLGLALNQAACPYRSGRMGGLPLPHKLACCCPATLSGTKSGRVLALSLSPQRLRESSAPTLPDSSIAAAASRELTGPRSRRVFRTAATGHSAERFITARTGHPASAGERGLHLRMP